MAAVVLRFSTTCGIVALRHNHRESRFMADTTTGKAATEGSIATAAMAFVFALQPLIPTQYQPLMIPGVGLLVALIKAARNEYAKSKAPEKRRRETDRTPG
jgi:hypothetical protein